MDSAEFVKLLWSIVMVAVVVGALVYWCDGGDDPPSGLT